ncbi:Mur ligase family protein, partial [Burkholderia cenocepacia]|nr:Mur ligase family protein [Burkholderia cenocepacia]
CVIDHDERFVVLQPAAEPLHPAIDRLEPLDLGEGRVNGTAFDIAVFTNLTQDHLDYHGTFDAYEAAKAKLFAWRGLRAAVINRDDAA